MGVFSRESDSRIANVRLSVCLSVRHRNPLASQNPVYLLLSLYLDAYRSLSLSIIKAIDHRGYEPSSLSTMEPSHLTNHLSRQSAILPPLSPDSYYANHQLFRDLSAIMPPLSMVPYGHYIYRLSDLLSRLLSHFGLFFYMF